MKEINFAEDSGTREKDIEELISIVVPVYNVEKYLDSCIKSILNQTYNNIEIILVDDGATDLSGQICDTYRELDHRIKVIHKKNGGLSDARNEGKNIATGSYIMFIDSDDTVNFDLIEYLYNLLKKGNADIAISDLLHCYPDKEISYISESKCCFLKSEKAINEMFYQHSFLVSACGKLYKRELFNTISFPNGILFEDVAIMPLLFEKCKIIAYGNAQKYGYRHRENSITTNKFTKKDLDILKISDDLYQRYISNSHLKKAARAYRITANLRVYLNAPNTTEYNSVINECKRTITRDWVSTFFDFNIRKKLRFSLILFLFGRTTMLKIYSHVDRWS